MKKLKKVYNIVGTKKVINVVNQAHQRTQLSCLEHKVCIETVSLADFLVRRQGDIIRRSGCQCHQKVALRLAVIGDEEIVKMIISSSLVCVFIIK